jgi:hypothetical protein
LKLIHDARNDKHKMCCSVYKEYFRALSGAVDIMCFYEDYIDKLDTERQLYLSRNIGKYEIGMCRLDRQYSGFHSAMDSSVAGVGTLVVIVTHIEPQMVLACLCSVLILTESAVVAFIPCIVN